LLRDPLGRLAERTIELKLGRVKIIDGGGVLLESNVERNQGGDNLLRPHDQPQQLARGPRGLAQADEVFVGRLGRLP
jgi:hypothetical protein